MYTYEHTCAAPVTHIHAHLSFCVGPQLLALEMDNTLLGIAVQSFNTLTEFCQGPCHENQETLVACNVCHEVNVVFRPMASTLDPVLVLELRSVAVVPGPLPPPSHGRPSKYPKMYCDSLHLQTLHPSPTYISLRQQKQSFKKEKGFWHHTEKGEGHIESENVPHPQEEMPLPPKKLFPSHFILFKIPVLVSSAVSGSPVLVQG
eukprot:EG_transcript_8116